MMFAKMVLLSIKRRKKEIGFVSIVTFIAVLFLAGVSLFQNVMNRYVIENNYKNYGEWIFASLDKELSHPYFASTGSCKTGAVILNDNGEQTAESIGCVDEGFLGFANLTFYEGRLPEKDDEIVMNLTTLAKLGYSLDLGQTIHLQVMVEREILQGEESYYETETYEKDFTLVGTIRDFSTTWRYVDGHPLASCIVTEEAMEQMGGSLYTTHFYQLDRAYEEIDKEEMKNKFLGEEGVVFNEYVYDKVVWGSPEMFEDMQELILLIAVLMLGYLMMSYVSKRRSWYYKLRCTGAGRHQIWAMIFIEGMYGTVPWAVFGFGVPYAVGAVACSIVSQKLAMPNIFVVDVAEICTQMITVAGIILLVLLVACLGTSDRRLSSNTAEVTSGQLWRLKWAAHGGRNKAKQFIKRQNVRNPWQKAAMAVCTFVVSTILVCCVCMIMEQYEYYELVTGNHHDFSAYKFEMIEGNSYTVVETDWAGEETEKEFVFTPEESLYRYDYGISEKLEKELDAIEGIAYREEELYDYSSKLVWDERRESATYQFRYEHDNANVRFVSDEERWRYIEDGMNYVIRIDTYKDLKKNYPMVFAHAQIDETAFLNGEQIVVVCPEIEDGYMTDDGGYVDVMVKDTTLKDGMQVIFQNSDMGVELPVEICLPEITNEQLTEGSKFLISNYMIFASTGFAERVAAAAGTQMEYNILKMDFEPNTAFGSTTKRLAAALVAHGFEYDLGWETKAMARDEFYKGLCVYGTLFCMIAITYLVLQMNVQQMKHYNRGAQYLQMKRLGMSNAFFLWLHVKEGIKDGLWLLPGLVTGYVIAIGIKEPLIFQPEEENWLMVVSSITGERTSEPFLVLYEYMKEQFQVEQFMVLIGILLFLMVMMIVIAIGTANKALRKEGETV